MELIDSNECVVESYNQILSCPSFPIVINSHVSGLKRASRKTSSCALSSLKRHSPDNDHIRSVLSAPRVTYPSWTGIVQRIERFSCLSSI